jgi:glucan phosphoethanolaminetransferase (alkaline phosphatase superfamily)
MSRLPHTIIINKTTPAMKKKISLASVFISLVIIGFAQVPQAFNYQAVVRNGSGDLIANQSVSFRISILQGFETVETIENLQLQIIEMDKQIKTLNEMIFRQQAQIEKLDKLTK